MHVISDLLKLFCWHLALHTPLDYISLTNFQFLLDSDAQEEVIGCDRFTEMHLLALNYSQEGFAVY